MRQNQSSQTLYTVTLVICVVMIVGAILERRKRDLRGFDQADLIEATKAETPAPTPEVDENEFDFALLEPSLSVQLARVARVLQPGIRHCLDRFWSPHPLSVRVRITADKGGRLESLAVQGAPDEAESCLLEILSRGQYPMSAEGVALLPLEYEAVHIAETY